MIPIVVTYLPWLLSAVTVLAMYLAGNRSRVTWPLSLFNQLLWLIWIVLSGTWGLLPMNLALWIVFTRNYLKWRNV